MTYPLYRDSAASAQSLLSNNIKLEQPNVGLWFTRFYEGFTPTWEVEKSSKKDFIELTAKLASQQDHAAHAQALAERQQRLCESLGGACMTLETTGPFVAGTGISHPVENGLSFHPTLGLPYLPASGVKGLLRAWVEVWMAHESDAKKQALIEDWFGYSGTGPDADGCAGGLIFFDALPTGSVTMKCDIMTPHMGDWYEKGDAVSAQNFPQVAPGDWHSPVPVPFLVVCAGVKFQWAVAPRLTGDAVPDVACRAAAAQALGALKEALEWVGAGAKTAVGYGRMVDTKAEEAQKRLDGFKTAGIAMGQEVWPEAKVNWDKGKVELVIENGSRKTAPLRQQPARDMRADLKPEDIAKIDKGKSVKVRAEVEVKGQLITLLRISSL